MRATLEQLPPRYHAQVREKLAAARPKKRSLGKGAKRGKGYPGVSIHAPNVSIERVRLQLKAEKIAGWVMEFVFHPTRGWRFDFAFPGDKVALEVEGLTHKFGRHQRFQGYTEDCKKYSEAALLGWKVLRVTPQMVRRGLAIDYIKRALSIQT